MRYTVSTENKIIIVSEYKNDEELTKLEKSYPKYTVIPSLSTQQEEDENNNKYMIVTEIEAFNTLGYTGNVLRTGKSFHDKNNFIKSISNFLNLNKNEVEELKDYFKD